MLLAALAVVGALAPIVVGSTLPSDPESPAQSPFEQSLDRLPADALDADGAALYYVDLEMAWERAGVGAEVEERFDRVGSMSTIPTWTQPPFLFAQYFAQLDEARAEVGFTMFDIDREISVQAPPNNVAIAEIRVSADDVAAAVQTDPLWSSQLTTIEHPGGAYFQWGDDPLATQLELRTPMRPLGQGGQLALIGSDSEATVVRTIDPADMEAVLSTAAGNGDSLLDDDFVAGAVAAIGDDEVLQVMAIDEAIRFDPAALILTPEAIEEILAETVLLQIYDGLMIVDLYDGAETRTEVLLVYPDAEAAETNAALVEQALAENDDLVSAQPLSELLPGAEVSTEGSVVVVALSFEGAYPLAQRMLVQRSLFPTE